MKLKNRQYEWYENYYHVAGKKGVCSTCNAKWDKGDEIVKGSFHLVNNSFIMRKKLYCSEECVPLVIKSGKNYGKRKII